MSDSRHGPGAESEPGDITPLDLLTESLCPTGQEHRVIQEAGFAVKIARPLHGDKERWLPPGQGQVIVALTGNLQLSQRTAPTGADALAAERSQRLERGDLALVPNDAHWCLSALAEGTTVLLVSTSVARTAQQQHPLLARARSMRLRNTQQLFANQRVGITLSALHPRLPLRRSLPPCADRNRYLVLIDGSLHGSVHGIDSSVPSWRGQLSAGSLIALPKDLDHQLRASGHGPAVALVIEPRGQAAQGDGPQPFTPFVAG